MKRYVDGNIKIKQNKWTGFLMMLSESLSVVGRLIVSIAVAEYIDESDKGSWMVMLVLMIWGVLPMIKTVLGSFMFKEGLWPRKNGDLK